MEPEEITKPGWWVVTGITGYFTRGDGWTTEDDVYWNYETVRPATQEEIDTLNVVGAQQ